MNFEKYSKQRFESLGLNTPAARKLADELQIDVNDEIHEAVLSAFQQVVQRLNVQGHRSLVMMKFDPEISPSVMNKLTANAACDLDAMS